MVTWEWTRSFQNPANGNVVAITHNSPGQTTIAANEYVVYAGARNLSGNTLGVGAAGGCGLASTPCWRNNPTGMFSSSEINQIESITSTFKNQVEKRNESSGFARWGGTISFDRTPPAAWHFNHTTAPPSNRTDFYSVALHELAHALGVGERDTNPSNVTAWESFVIGSSFYGNNARAANGGPPVQLNPLTEEGATDLSHWAMNKSSVVFGGSAVQEAAMDPDLATATRKYFTALDAAAMKDIGWTVITPPALYGDYNNNGIVNAADYLYYRKRLGQSVTIPNDQTPGTVTPGDYYVWRNNFGSTLGAGGTAGVVPEPSGAMLAIAGCLAGWFARRKRRG
jgi:hypothetical protein